MVTRKTTAFCSLSRVGFRYSEVAEVFVVYSDHLVSSTRLGIALLGALRLVFCQ